jgi:hypothetical protein
MVSDVARYNIAQVLIVVYVQDAHRLRITPAGFLPRFKGSCVLPTPAELVLDRGPHFAFKSGVVHFA